MINLLQAMQVFVRVADAGSFAQAAAQLKVSTSIVTRHVANLESHLGIRLLQRTTRKIALTESGREYILGCRAVLGEIAEIETRATLASNEIAGDLRIVASGSFSLFQLAPFLATYQSAYPRVGLRLSLTEQPVDLLDAGYDVGIVADRMITSSSLIARRLVRASRVPVASPPYLSAAGSPRVPADLPKHRILSQTQDTRTQVWTFASTEQEQISVTPSFTVNNAIMLKQAAIAGMGIALLPAGLVADDLLAGTLIRLLPSFAVVNADVEISLVYPSRQYIPQKVRAFIDSAIDYFR